jgi:DNA-binding NarL/FixJ family response regulator
MAMTTHSDVGVERHGQALRIVVGDDQPFIREGVAHVLREAGFDVVATACDAPELMRKARAHRPDVVIADIQMPPDRTDDGLRAAQAIRAERPEVAVLILSQFLESRYALELVGDRAQGVGYLLKDRVGDFRTFVDAVRRVASGGSALDPTVVAHLVGRPRRESPIDELTPKEREVLALMAEGRSNQGIANALVVSVPAIERHVTNIFGKLGLQPGPEEHRRVLAVLEYLRQ